MAVTLEQAHILLKLDMDTGCFQQALDAMRRYVLAHIRSWSTVGVACTCRLSCAYSHRLEMFTGII